MKRSLIILIFGLVAAAVAGGVAYRMATAKQREVCCAQDPELAWVKKEFQLTDDQFTQLCKLNADYQPECKTMCDRIDGQNQELLTLLGKSESITPEVEAALAQAAKLRLECQNRMLAHFYEVARTMPPDRARRYLEWVHKKTLLPARRLDSVVSDHAHGK